jgi:hypothetical protein
VVGEGEDSLLALAFEAGSRSPLMLNAGVHLVNSPAASRIRPCARHPKPRFDPRCGPRVPHDLPELGATSGRSEYVR